MHALFHLLHAGLGAVVGHVGFDKVIVDDDSALDTHAYTHYLHHRYFEVNYADGMIPLDQWFGTWHDGTKDADQRMNARLKERARRLEQRKQRA